MDEIFRAALAEAVEEVTVLNKTFSVLRNPGITELAAAARGKSLRGLVDQATGDTYWWAASVAIHPSVARSLGLSGDVYANDGTARLELRGKVLAIISGWVTAVRSPSLRHLLARGIGVKYGRETIDFDAYIARMEKPV
jgi:hypothetical protein